MKELGLVVSFLTLLVFVLPSLTDEKKDVKKDEVKKDEEKPEPKKAPEKLAYGAKFYTKILSANANNGRDLTVEIQEIDPKKVQDLQSWQAQRQQQLQQAYFNLSTQKDFKARYTQMQTYQKDMYNFKIELAKRQTNIYSSKPLEVRAAENVKVRAMRPPVEFDDQGFEKKWTKKELEERRDKTGLPGFPVEFDQLKSGQLVEIYLAKQAAPAKAKKKGGPGDDDPGGMGERKEFVMIVIMQEGK